MMVSLLRLVVASAVCVLVASTSVSEKSYSCVEGVCQLNARGQSGLSHGICLTTCGAGNLWPYPSGAVSISTDFLTIADLSGDKFKFRSNMVNDLSLFEENFIKSVSALLPSSDRRGSTGQSPVSVELVVDDPSVTLPSTTNDESYDLKVSAADGYVLVTIHGQTRFGVRHGLETLSQLISYDYFAQSLVIPASVSITDKPAFPYRGVMVDVSRNFISVTKLKETIRAMGYNKMNVLHLHLSDTASFPLEMVSQPNMTAYGAYDSKHIYSQQEVAELVTFAHSYGVMILPEIDTPAHVSAGWQWGVDAGLGNFTLCADPDGTHGSQWAHDSLEPPSGQLNVVNENVYPVLESVYREVIGLFLSDSFHLGGDEVIVGSDEAWAACYNSTTLAQPILDHLAALGLSRDDPRSFYELWDNFTMRATAMVQDIYANGATGGAGAADRKRVVKVGAGADTNAQTLNKIHVWGGAGADASGVTYNMMLQPTLTSILPPSLFNIQVWDTTEGSITKTLIDKGYDVILSNTDYVYLDCGNAGFTNAGGYWCQPYHEWYHIYDYVRDVTNAWGLSAEQLQHVQGSETLIWTEMVDDQNLSQKLWPRSAALAEALWSGNNVPASANRAAKPTKKGDKNRPTGQSAQSTSEDDDKRWYDAAGRMLQWRELLVTRGVAAEALMPRWCTQRDAYACYLDTGVPQ